MEYIKNKCVKFSQKILRGQNAAVKGLRLKNKWMGIT